jgi:hypothetical protein
VHERGETRGRGLIRHRGMPAPGPFTGLVVDNILEPITVARNYAPVRAREIDLALLIAADAEPSFV